MQPTPGQILPENHSLSVVCSLLLVSGRVTSQTALAEELLLLLLVRRAVFRIKHIND